MVVHYMCDFDLGYKEFCTSICQYNTENQSTVVVTIFTRKIDEKNESAIASEFKSWLNMMRSEYSESILVRHPNDKNNYNFIQLYYPELLTYTTKTFFC